MQRKKILCVDDSATILMMERMILSKGPYDLVTASDGEEAVSKAMQGYNFEYDTCFELKVFKNIKRN